MSQSPRERATVDLRGIGPRLRVHAAARGKTTATVIRGAVTAMLDAEGTVPVKPVRPSASIDRRVVKMTVRLDASHAGCLVDRARRAYVSQGAYVTGLLDGMPPAPRATDHAEAVSALVASTQRVAALSTDIHGFLRLMRNGKAGEAEKYRVGLMALAKDVRLHLEVASRLMAALTSRPNGWRSTTERGGRVE